MKFTNIHIKKARRKAYIVAAIGLFLLVAAVAIYIHGYIIVKDKKAKEMNLLDAGPVTDVIAHVDVVDEPPSQFANKDSEGFYFVYDGQYYYIVSYKESKHDKIVEEFEQNGGKITLRGYTNYMDNDLVQIAINTINSSMGQNVINADNYGDLLGNVYLKVDNNLSSAYSNLVLGHLLFVIILGIAGAVTSFYGFCGVWKKGWIDVSPYISDEDLDRELNSINSTWYDEIGIYIIEEYIVYIHYISGVSVFRFSDIVQAYQAQHSTNGGIDRVYMVIRLNDGTQHEIGDAKHKSNKAYMAIDEISKVLMVMSEKNTEMVIGYTED